MPPKNYWRNRAFDGEIAPVTRATGLLAGVVWLFIAIAATNAPAGDLFGVVPPAGDAFTPETLRSLQPTEFRLPWIALADRPLESISSAYTNVAVSTPRRRTPLATGSVDAAKLNDDWRSQVYTSGEVGFLYGHSAGGKHSFDTEQGYIFGTVGNDNIQISAGAAYQRWNSRGWRGH